jgi:hypothetical protein
MKLNPLPLAPPGGKRLLELRIDQIGQGRRVGLVANVPGLSPGELGVGCAGTAFGHLGQAEIDASGADCGEEQALGGGWFVTFEMSKDE